MSTHSTLSKSDLKSALDYDPNTGIFTWKPGRKLDGARAGTVSDSHNGYSYVRINLNGKIYYAHRLAFLWMLGRWPSAYVVHRDRNGLNNAWKNLREATQSQNMGNSKSRNPHGAKGVRRTPSGRWQVVLKKDGKNVYCGTHDSLKEATAVSEKASRNLFGEFSRK